MKIPGIGSYNLNILKDNIKGIYIPSKYKSTQATSFTHK